MDTNKEGPPNNLLTEQVKGLESNVRPLEDLVSGIKRGGPTFLRQAFPETPKGSK